MAIAGKVAITPGGEWSVDFAYDKLVVVTFGNNVYLSIKPSTGIEPTNEEHWMLLIENVTQEQYDNIINGTTTVGNANKLGGKDASEYLTKSGGKITGTNDTPIALDGKGQILIKFLIDGIYKGYLGFDADGKLVAKVGTNSWTELATTADLANYLPLSGGKVGNGSYHSPISINGNAYAMIEYLNNGSTMGFLGFNGENTPVFYSTSGVTFPLIHSFNVGNYAVKKDEASIDTTLTTALTINSRNEETNTLIQFSKNGARQGFIGFKGADVPYFLKSTADGGYALLHTGNKPTFTYTGTGSSSQRIIDTGASISNAYIIRASGSESFAIVTASGYIATDGTTVTCGKDIKVNNSDLELYTSSILFNASGTTYYGIAL